MRAVLRSFGLLLLSFVFCSRIDYFPHKIYFGDCLGCRFYRGFFFSSVGVDWLAMFVIRNLVSSLFTPPYMHFSCYVDDIDLCV